jgi:hypothetical protein
MRLNISTFLGGFTFLTLYAMSGDKTVSLLIGLIVFAGILLILSALKFLLDNDLLD